MTLSIAPGKPCICYGLLDPSPCHPQRPAPGVFISPLAWLLCVPTHRLRGQRVGYSASLGPSERLPGLSPLAHGLGLLPKIIQHSDWCLPTHPDTWTLPGSPRLLSIVANTHIKFLFSDSMPSETQKPECELNVLSDSSFLVRSWL